MKTLWPLLVASLALTVLPAAAAAAPAGLGLGAHGGYGQSADAEEGSPTVGAHLVLNVASWLGVVGSVDFKFKEDLVESGIDYDVESYPITLMGRVYLPLESFSPYVAGGFEYRIIKYGGDLFEDFEVDDSEEAFGWVAGAGAAFNPSESFEIFGEILYEAIDAERDLGNAIEDAEDFEYDQWSVRAGITFYLN